MLARAEWHWLEWQASAKLSRELRAMERLRDADLPAYLKRDIGLM
jgi:hypothetical protein